MSLFKFLAFVSLLDSESERRQDMKGREEGSDVICGGLKM